MVERWRELNEPRKLGINLILDASESAKGGRENILRLAISLARRLKCVGAGHLFFIGSSKEYDLSSLQESGDVWMRDNRNRGSFVTPIFKNLDPNALIPVVLFHKGRVFDIDDWTDSPIYNRLFAVPFDEHTLSSDQRHRIQPDPDAVMRVIDFPIRSVRILALSAFPFVWDNPAYQLTYSDTSGAVLQANWVKDCNFCVRVGMLEEDTESPVTAEIRLDDNSLRTLDLVEAKPLRKDTPSRWLHDDESKLFRQCVEKGRFECPLCRGTHDKATLRCKDSESSGILDEPVYSSLSNISSAKGFILCQEDANTKRVRMRRHDCNVLRINEGRVAVRLDGSQVRLFDYDSISCRWRRSKEIFTQYLQTEEDEYAIVL
jgi:hypothetical protein